ncbi:MAG TPA: GAF domain-containing protein [Chloroflexota bacterium]
MTMPQESTAPVPGSTDERDYFGIAQAADLLGVSRVSVWRWINAGYLPAARLGQRTTRIRRQDLEWLLDERATAKPRSWVARGTRVDAGQRRSAAPRIDWRGMDPPEHFVQFYDVDAFLLDAVKDFVGATLRAGDAAVVIATAAHRSGLEDRLRADGLDLDATQADGRYVFLDADEMLAFIMDEGRPEPGRFTDVVGGVIRRASEGGRRVRAFGEMVALLAVEGNYAAAVRLEELWNDLRARLPFALFCAYPLESLNGETGAAAIGDVCAAHARVIPAESYTALPTTDDRLRAIAMLQQQARGLEAARLAASAARDEAEAARKRLAMAQEAGHIGTFEWDTTTGQVTWTTQLEALYGLMPGTFGGTYDHWLRLVHPLDRDGMDEAVRGTAPENGGLATTFRVIWPDGSVRILSAQGTIVRDEAGIPTRVVGVNIDVTERARAEALLSGQKQILEAIATGAALADVLTALIRLIEDQSDGMLCSILVRDPECERFNLGLAPSLPDTFIDSLAHAPITPLYFGPCGRAAHLGVNVIVEDVATDHRWEGQWRPLALSHGLRTCYSIPIVAAGGNILGSFGMYYREPRDPKPPNLQLIETATHLAGIAIARKRADDALREETETLETINHVGRLLTAELDLEALAQAVTDAATALSGAQVGAFFYNSVDERGDAYQLYALAGARREDFTHYPIPRNTAIFGPTFRGEGVVRLDDVTEDPRYGLNAPYHGLPPGHLPVRSYLAVPVIARSGQVIGGLFMGHSGRGIFTARAERLVSGLAAQAAIAMDNARLYQEARQAIQARDGFLAAAAHDLKTPLTGIKGMAELLHRRATRASAPEARQLADGLLDGLRTIDQTATRMSELINSMLDLTRMRLDAPLELDRRPTDLVALARQVMAVLEPTVTGHRPRIETDLAELAGSWDRARLARVVDNLLANAIKFSPGGGPITVSIRLEQERPGEAEWAALAVRDSGVGIPAAELARIFERFQRASNVIGTIEGTGIGLASARHIVESHGGILTVESEEGRGSTFTVRLPLAANQAPDDTAKEQLQASTY